MNKCEAFPSVFWYCSVFGIAHQPWSLRLHTPACPLSAPSSMCRFAAPCGLCVPSGTFPPQDALPADGSWDARLSVGRTRVGRLPQLGVSRAHVTAPVQAAVTGRPGGGGAPAELPSAQQGRNHASHRKTALQAPQTHWAGEAGVLQIPGSPRHGLPQQCSDSAS